MSCPILCNLIGCNVIVALFGKEKMPYTFSICGKLEIGLNSGRLLVGIPPTYVGFYAEDIEKIGELEGVPVIFVGCDKAQAPQVNIWELMNANLRN